MFDVKITGLKAKVTNSELLTTGRVGAQVKFTFSDDWADKTKIAVFKRCGKVIDILESEWSEDNIVTIPPEMTEKAGQLVGVGIYGRNANGKKLTPTIYAPLGVVAVGADPSGDESTDPTLPVFSQIQAELSRTVKVDPQDFTDDEKTQARENIRAMPIEGEVDQGNNTLYIKNAGSMYESAVDINMSVNGRKRLHQIGGIGFVTTMYEDESSNKVAAQAILHANSISVGDRRYSPAHECQLLHDGITTTRQAPMYIGKTASHVDLVSHQLKNVKDPTDDQDAATKKYVDDNGFHVGYDTQTKYQFSPVTKAGSKNDLYYYRPVQRFDTVDDLKLLFGLSDWTFIIDADTSDGYLAGILKIPNMQFPIVMEPRTADSPGASVEKYRYFVTMANQEIWQVDLVKTTSSPSYVYNVQTLPVFIPRRQLEIDTTQTGESIILKNTREELDKEDPLITWIPDVPYIPFYYNGGLLAFAYSDGTLSRGLPLHWYQNTIDTEDGHPQYDYYGTFLAPRDYGAGVMGSNGTIDTTDPTIVWFPFGREAFDDGNTLVVTVTDENKVFTYIAHGKLAQPEGEAWSIPYQDGYSLYINQLVFIADDTDCNRTKWKLHKHKLRADTITATGNNTDGWTFTGDISGELTIADIVGHVSDGAIMYIPAYGYFYPRGIYIGSSTAEWITLPQYVGSGAISCFVMSLSGPDSTATLRKCSWQGTIETI